MPKKKLVVLTGSGVSAESGIQTFRGGNGLWEKYRFEDLASPGAWSANPELVLRFYNERRQTMRKARPNAAHLALAAAEKDFDVAIVTQNVDDLHERAGSSRIVHLHGELRKARSTLDESLVYDLGEKDIEIGDACDLGSQLRPHIVWFGEAVPTMDQAASLVGEADIFAVVGTSLAVYPAASLIDFCRPGIQQFVIDPQIPDQARGMIAIPERASTGVPRMFEMLAKS